MHEAMQWLADHGGCCCDCEVIGNIGPIEQGLLAKLWYQVKRNSTKAVLLEKLFSLAEEDHQKRNEKTYIG
jgi:hypothetical protein